MKNPRLQTHVHAASVLVFALVLALSKFVFAHGPEDHGAQSSGAVASQQSTPRFEAATDLFELVAVLTGGELSILIDRFETNVPVLEAQVEVESGGRKAMARYRADRGDYVVADPALLAVVARPGEHATVITVASKDESDLLNGTLVVGEATTRSGAAGHAHGDHDPALERVLIAVALVVLLALMAVIWQRARRKRQWGLGTAQQVQP